MMLDSKDNKTLKKLLHCDSSSAFKSVDDSSKLQDNPYEDVTLRSDSDVDADADDEYYSSSDSDDEDDIDINQLFDKINKTIAKTRQNISEIRVSLSATPTSTANPSRLSYLISSMSREPVTEEEMQWGDYSTD